MSTVVLHNVVSLDGYVAGPDDDPGPIFDWYFNGDHHLTAQDMADPAPGGLRVSRTSYDYVRPMWDAIGCTVIGRHLFDLTNGWEGHPPAGEHVVVVSHRPKPEGWHPEAAYHFRDDVTAAIATARELAGEVAMDLAPVVLGSGKPFFGAGGTRHLLEDPHVVIQGDRVLHLRFRVRR